MSLILFAGIGFLLAVLSTDLIFDSTTGKSSKDALKTTSFYYRRIASEPFLLFGVMLIMLVILVLQIILGPAARWMGWVSLILFLIPTIFAGVYIIPTAQRLGSRADPVEKQNQLVRSLFWAHVFCLVLMIAFGAFQFYIARGV